jgi:hypothetical protein
MSRAQRSDSDSSEGPGAAQFLTNLSPHEIQHLQLAVLKKEETESFSQFLEEPRNVPVPKRFMFNPAELARLKENQKDARKENGTHARKGSVKSRQSGDGSSRSDVHSPSRGLLVELKRVASADWRFYTTGVCLCVMNLVAAWDATAISIALPVSQRQNTPLLMILKVALDDCDEVGRFHFRDILGPALVFRDGNQLLTAFRSLERHIGP